MLRAASQGRKRKCGPGAQSDARLVIMSCVFQLFRLPLRRSCCLGERERRYRFTCSVNEGRLSRHFPGFNAPYILGWTLVQLNGHEVHRGGRRVTLSHTGLGHFRAIFAQINSPRNLKGTLSLYPLLYSIGACKCLV